MSTPSSSDPGVLRNRPAGPAWRIRLYDIVFDSEDPAAKAFDVALIAAILLIVVVGFGDITPSTPAGKLLAAVIMLMGYGLIAVPTGIFSAELAHASSKHRESSPNICPACGIPDHDADARFCKHCGGLLGGD